MLDEELLHLGAIVELQQGAVAPHDGEDEESLEVHRRHVARRNQALEQVTRLHTQTTGGPSH